MGWGVDRVWHLTYIKEVVEAHRQNPNGQTAEFFNDFHRI
jgi:hypothetical protein